MVNNAALDIISYLKDYITKDGFKVIMHNITQTDDSIEYVYKVTNVVNDADIVFEPGQILDEVGGIEDKLRAESINVIASFSAQNIIEIIEVNHGKDRTHDTGGRIRTIKLKVKKST